MNPQAIKVGTIKVSIPVDPASIPIDLVPPEPRPAGNPVLKLVLEGGTHVTVLAQLSGKSARRAMKLIGESGAGSVSCAIQGNLKPPTAPGGPFTLEAAGLQVFVKSTKPEEPTPLPI